MKKILLALSIILSMFSLTANAHSTNYRHQHQTVNQVVIKKQQHKHYNKHYTKHYNKYNRQHNRHRPHHPAR
jgi:type III secretory pathway component EscR